MNGLGCLGCGQPVTVDDPAPFRCPRAGDGREHVLARRPPSGWPIEPAGAGAADAAIGCQPFVR